MLKRLAVIVIILLSASLAIAQDMTIDSNGLTVEGNIEIRGGGIIFPDGTVLDNAHLDTNNGSTHGQPFQALQQQIDDLQNQINNIQLIPGPQGQQGLQGEQGVQGDKGDIGDTGAQGVKGDKGETGIEGTDGLNCWDLNSNGICDATTEDITGDNMCNALDCHGLHSDINVYDANGQYLGLFASINTHSQRVVVVYIPSLQSSLIIDLDNGNVLTSGNSVALRFRSNDCTGQPYISNVRSLNIYRYDPKFYKATGAPVENFIRGSYTDSYFGSECIVGLGTGTPDPHIAAEEVTIPFTLPVALPLSFE